MMFWYGHDMVWWSYLGTATLIGVFWILAFGGIAASAKFLLHDRPTQRKAASEPDRPADVLAARFARGEIDEPEYRDRLATLYEYGLR